MDQNRFFRAVWQFNGLLLAAGGILFVVTVGWSLISWPLFRTTPEGHFTPVPKSAEKDHTYRLSRLQFTLDREAFFQLGRWDGDPGKYGLQSVRTRGSYEYAGPDTVNLLAVDSTSGASHWLFHGFDREIVSEDTITRPDAKPEPMAVFAPGGKPPASGTSVIALVIHTIDTDTDKDGALTDKDKQSLYVYRPGSGFAAKLLDVDYLLSSDQSGDARYLIVYERGKTAIAAAYSLPDFKLVSEKPIPPVPN